MQKNSISSTPFNGIVLMVLHDYTSLLQICITVNVIFQNIVFVSFNS